MRALRQLEARRQEFGDIPQAISRCCRDLTDLLHRHPNPKSWARVQVLRVLEGEETMVVARFHAIPSVTDPATILLIVGLLEPFSPAQPPEAPPSSADFRFSEREQACIAHLAQGMTDKEIARQLGISEYTVKDHFKQVRKKTGAANRAAIIVRVLGRAQVGWTEALVAQAVPSRNSR